MNEQDQRVRDYYENMSLPQDKLDILLKHASAESSNSRPNDLELNDLELSDLENDSEQVAVKQMPLKQWLSYINPVRRHRWLPAGIACAFVLLTSLWIHNSYTDSERMQQTVREVAMNHSTRLEPEYYGKTLAMLDNSMQQLPFALELPKSIDSAIDSAYELIGSRYCSLGGVLAAHVRLKSQVSGKSMSLFVTSNSAELKDIRSQQTTLEGVDVEFWREGGLFYALAQRS